MATYAKLGEKAESFYDPHSELALAGKEVVKLTPKQLASTRVKQALSGGHLRMATEQEFNIFTGVEEPEEVETIESPYGKNAEELTAYYQKTYEVTAADLKKFKKKSLEAMVAELKKLEE